MRQCPFVDREDELGALRDAYGKRPALVVVYGRRRLGKTRLVKEFLEAVSDGKTLYYVASLAGHQYNLRMLMKAIAGSMGGFGSVTVEDLTAALRLLYMAGLKVIVLDEFTYWVRAAPRAASEVQVFVDEYLPDTDLLLVLMGSHVGVMKNHVLGGGAPLYGRASVRIKLGMLPFEYTARFYPSLAPEDLVRVYGMVGGVPFYNCLLRGVESLREAVEALIGSPGAPLIEEPLLLLREELREPAVYYTILSAIARGFRTPTRISNYAGVPLPHVSKYLSVLEFLGLVRREAPLFRKKGKYRIVDPPLRTYYTLVEPVRSLLELGRYDAAVSSVLREVDNLVAEAWEELARSHLSSVYTGQGYTIVGRAEHKGEEIDAVALDRTSRRAVIAEVKWSDLSRAEAERIRRRALTKASRLLPGYRIEEAYVYARSIIGPRAVWAVTPADMLYGTRSA